MLERSVRDHLSGTLSRCFVRREHLLDRRGYLGQGLTQHTLYCTRDAQERDATFEECSHGDLVRGVERDAGGRSGFGRLISKPQAREAVEIRRREVQLAQRGQVE